MIVIYLGFPIVNRLKPNVHYILDTAGSILQIDLPRMLQGQMTKNKVQPQDLFPINICPPAHAVQVYK